MDGGCHLFGPFSCLVDRVLGVALRHRFVATGNTTDRVLPQLLLLARFLGEVQ